VRLVYVHSPAANNLSVHHDLVPGVDDQHISQNDLVGIDRSFLPFADHGRLGAGQQGNVV
jgi:hypothetical protein